MPCDRERSRVLVVGRQALFPVRSLREYLLRAGTAGMAILYRPCRV